MGTTSEKSEQFDRIEQSGRWVRGQVAGEFMTENISLDQLMENMIKIAETGTF